MQGVKLVLGKHSQQLQDTPLLVNLPTHHKSNLQFSVFHHRDETDLLTSTTNASASSSSSSHRSKRKRLAVCARSENIVYSNYGQLEEEDVESGNLCSYLVGMLSEDGKSVVLRQVPPIADVRCSVDRFDEEEENDDSASSKLIGDKNMIARNQLGEAFGSKKRKIQIKQMEQNKVDVDSVERVADALNKTIQSSAAARITKEQIEEMVHKERPIPPFNLDATTPAQVYNLDDIAPKSEVKTISIKDFMNVKLKADLKKATDKIHASAWVLERIHNGMQTKKDHKYLKKLVYLLYLMRFFTLRDFQIQKALDKEDEADNSNDNNEEGGEVADVNPDRLLKVFGFAPRPVVEGFIRRFVEIVEVDGRKIYKTPTKLKDKCLAYILAMTLILEEYRVDPTLLAKDMNLSLAKVTSMFKELGCKVDHLKKSESSTGIAQKYAHLAIPLSFPKKTR